MMSSNPSPLTSQPPAVMNAKSRGLAPSITNPGLVKGSRVIVSGMGRDPKITHVRPLVGSMAMLPVETTRSGMPSPLTSPAAATLSQRKSGCTMVTSAWRRRLAMSLWEA